MGLRMRAKVCAKKSTRRYRLATLPLARNRMDNSFSEVCFDLVVTPVQGLRWGMQRRD